MSGSFMVNLYDEALFLAWLLTVVLLIFCGMIWQIGTWLGWRIIGRISWTHQQESEQGRGEGGHPTFRGQPRGHHHRDQHGDGDLHQRERGDPHHPHCDGELHHCGDEQRDLINAEIYINMEAEIYINMDAEIYITMDTEIYIIMDAGIYTNMTKEVNYHNILAITIHILSMAS
eukprot:s4398_g13.t1